MLTSKEKKELKNLATDIRLETIKEIGNLGVGHTSGSLSIADVLAVLYGKVMKILPKKPKWEGRDWFVLSKGHAGPAVYAALSLKGFFPLEELKTLNIPGTNLPSHCDWTKTKGIDMTTGSLGQGASSAMGIALAHKMDNMNNYIYTIFGDGECQEGQIWEAALFASHHKLDNVIAFVDYNKQQIDGFTRDVCDIGDICNKFTEFGWHSQEIDGHNVSEIYEAIKNAKKTKGKPSMIVLHTIKGKGWSRLEGKLDNHNGPVSKDLMEEAINEIKKQYI